MPVLKVKQDGVWKDVTSCNEKKDIYVQNEEPVDTPHGTLWIDLDDELETWTWGDY